MVDEPKQDDEVRIEEWQQCNGYSGSEDKLSGMLNVTIEQNGKLTFKAKGFKLQHYTWIVDYNVDCAFNLTE